MKPVQHSHDGKHTVDVNLPIKELDALVTKVGGTAITVIAFYMAADVVRSHIKR